MRRTLLLVAAALLGAACAPDARPLPPRTRVIVDRAVPMAEQLRRFRADLPERPAGLRGGRVSREALVRRLVAATEANDTAAFGPLTLDRAEFAYLLFPESPQSRPPYELPPGVAWLQMQERNRQGLFRLLREHGGRPLEYQGHRCTSSPRMEGRNRIWTGCVLRLGNGSGTAAEVRLFGAVVERDGRFKFLSYANDL